MRAIPNDEPRESARSARPPRLALVVGSGGVRSIAAVGIADALARAGVPVDLVAGCSSGALFGACIASGMSGEESLQSATRLWSAELTERRRWRAAVELLAPRLAGFGEGFALRDDRMIVERLSQAFGDRLIEELPIPLRIAATEAASGKPAVLRRGRLVDALRASMAVPFVFPSVEFEGRRMIDGVVSDPLPVSACDDAELVVAVGFEGSMPRRIDRASRLVARSATAMINNLQRSRIEAARASGRKLLCVELGLQRHVGLWETGALRYVYAAGCHAGRLHLPQVRELLGQGSHRAAA